jgi:tetratricopeptide (TPR) repeat protein
LAWSEQLRADGRIGEADRWLDRGHVAWPGELRIIDRIATRARHAGDVERYRRVLDPAIEIPDVEAAAPVLALRARARAEGGDLAGAQADLENALQLDGENRRVRLLAGDAYVAIGDLEAARRIWTRDLFLLKQDARDSRVRLMQRLAQLEERHGSPGAALRLWRQILEIDPGYAPAKAGRERLTGFGS